MSWTLIIFWAFAGLALVSALCCITRRNAVASALWLVVTLFSLAALFVLLDAQFIAVLQVLVYAGAIMVLLDRKSTRLNSSHLVISYAVFCLKKKTSEEPQQLLSTTHPKRPQLEV